jgi:hypothetical protein
MNFGARTGVRGIMTEPKKPINFFKMLPSFQSPGIKVGLQHGDAEEPAAIDVRLRRGRRRPSFDKLSNH